MNFSKFFIDRPRFAFVIAIVISVAGITAMLTLPVTQYPNITPSQVQITTKFPGADAETVLKTVVQPVETEVNGVKRMLYISSTSADDGSAVITVTCGIGTDGDINTVNVQNCVNRAQPRLPVEVKSQGVVVKEKSNNLLLVITLSSPENKYDSLFLSNYIRLNVLDEIKRIPGIADANILGELKYSMRIWLDVDRMASLKISVDDVIQALKEQNVQVAAGAVGDAPSKKTQVSRYTLQTQGRLEKPEEFAQIVVRALPTGEYVRIKDIAKVKLGSELYSSGSSLANKPAALLGVYQLSDANGIDIARKCKEVMKRLKKKFPEGLEYGVQYDTTKFIEASINEVISTLIVAVILVILITYLFLQDWRSTLIPTAAIPVSLIGTFAMMQLAGYSINLITLFGLILAIGIVVDDAIVVIENVNRLMDEEGLDAKTAARRTMEEISGAVVATTLVLLAMFIPICFMPGITGELYRQFGITISVAVSISTINALTLSPALSGCLLRPGSSQRNFWGFKLFNKFFDKTTGGYSMIVSKLVRKSALVLLAYAILTVITFKLYTMIPTGFIPEEDQGAFMVNVQLPDCSSLARTKKISEKATVLMKETPGIKYCMAVSGYSMLTSTNASNNAFLIATLDDWEKRKTPELSQEGIINTMRRKFQQIPGAALMPFSIPPIPGLGAAGGFSLVIEDTSGVDVKRLSKAVDSIVAEANKHPALIGVFSTFRANVPRFFLELDREKAMKMGVSIQSLNNALQGFEGSMYINDFNIYGNVFKVMIQADTPYRSQLEDLDSIYVRNQKGEMVPMTTVMKRKTKFGAQYINRYNLYTSATINGNPAPGYSSGEAMKAMEEISEKLLPRGMTYEWTDMSYQEKLAGNAVLIIFALALLFIYLFLVAQYESWMIPFAVMLSVPVAFFGALFSLWMFGIENNIYTQVGFVLLFGLATKTAILIVEFAKEQHEKNNMAIVESAIFAAKLRFRAVVMTAISFILGTMPLVIATGAGAISRRSLGTAVFGGMTCSMIFGTILVPAFYVVIQYLIELADKKKKAAAEKQEV